ncbi:hypothetical protein C4577_00155 [Candidatus Parcubacteria bacterium]|nr:MAG: hypothetical protein C4577_00155 [Candidatus Parcubacteria bacterium]
MRKLFYSHLVEIDSLIVELNSLDLSEEEKNHLVSLAHSSLEHTILDAILSELSEEDKKLFLTHLAQEKHDKIWEVLNSKIENIEEKIKKTAEALKIELRKDIDEAKSKH